MEKDDASYSERDTEQRREAALKRMLATPPKPHSESAGKNKKKRKLSPRKIEPKG